MMSFENDPQKCEIWNTYTFFFFFFALAFERICIETITALKVDVIGPETIPFAGASRNFTGWGSEGVKVSVDVKLHWIWTWTYSCCSYLLSWRASRVWTAGPDWDPMLAVSTGVTGVLTVPALVSQFSQQKLLSFLPETRMIDSVLKQGPKT